MRRRDFMQTITGALAGVMLGVYAQFLQPEVEEVVYRLRPEWQHLAIGADGWPEIITFLEHKITFHIYDYGDES